MNREDSKRWSTDQCYSTLLRCLKLWLAHFKQMKRQREDLERLKQHLPKNFLKTGT